MMCYFSIGLQRWTSITVVGFLQLLTLVNCCSYSVPRNGRSSRRPGRSVSRGQRPRRAAYPDWTDWVSLEWDDWDGWSWDDWETPEWNHSWNSWDNWDSDTEDDSHMPGYVIPLAVVCLVLAGIVFLIFILKRQGCCKVTSGTTVTSTTTAPVGLTPIGQTVHVPPENIPLNPAAQAPSYPPPGPLPPIGPHYPAATQPYPPPPTSGPAYPPQPSSGPAYPPQPTSGPAYPPHPMSGQPYAPVYPPQTVDNAPPPYPVSAVVNPPPPTYEQAKDMLQTANPSETKPSAPPM